MPKKKEKRQPGFFHKTVHRDARGRFVSESQSFRSEDWTFRKTKSGRIKDLKVSGGMVASEGRQYFPTVPIPEKGARAGKLSAQISSHMRKVGALRRPSKITVIMTARTYHGKIVKRKVSWETYHMKNKLAASASAIILQSLFYDYDDRPAYPVKIVKGWRRRETTKKETEKRRQLYDVRLHIESEIL